MMHKILNNKTYLIFLLIFLTIFNNIKAFNCVIKEPIELQNTFNLNFEFDSKDEIFTNLNDGYFIEIIFDDNKLKYRRFDVSDTKISKRNFRVDSESFRNKVNIFLTPTKAFKNAMNFETTFSLEVTFKIKNNIFACETPLDINLVNPEGNEVTPIKSENICFKGHPDAEKCKLSSLELENPNIPLNFSPDIFDYEITVNHDVKYLNFKAIPINENLKVKIKPNKLHPAGEYTDIFITVSNPNLKIKTVYTVHVFRKPKPEKEPKPSKKKSEKHNTKTLKDDSKDDNPIDFNNDENFTNLTDDSNTNTENLAPSNADLPSENIETLKQNPNNFRIYLLIVFLVVIALLSAYLIYKNIKMNIKKSKKSDLTDKKQSNK